jgi:hypothetical protein
MSDEKKPDVPDFMLPGLRASEAARRAMASLVATMTRLPTLPDGWLASFEAAMSSSAAAMRAAAQMICLPAHFAAFSHAALEGLDRQVEQMRRSFAESIAAMPEEEREELRRAIEDAPLLPVDVDAPGVM